MSIICTLLSTISCLPLQEDNERSDGPFPSYYVERVASLTFCHGIEMHVMLQ